MLAARLDVVLCYCAEGVAGLAPLLRHLEQVGGLGVHLQRLVNAAAAAKQACKEACNRIC